MEKGQWRVKLDGWSGWVDLQPRPKAPRWSMTRAGRTVTGSIKR